MNTFRYYSDLHGHLPEFRRDSDNREICILAGDVDDFGKKGNSLYLMLQDLTFRFKEVIFVPGNHEYYGTHIGTLERKVLELMEHDHNFTLLQAGEYVERDGVRIIGATLWSDTSSIDYEAGVKMNDYRFIRYGPDAEPWRYKLKPMHTTYMHWEHVRKIKGALSDWDGPSIVVTHHAPSTKSIDRKFEGDRLNPAYATDILLDKWPTYWIHGHIHRAVNYEHNGCRVLSNPAGYQSEYTDFEPLLNTFSL